MLIGLFTILFTVLSGGSEEPFILKNAKKTAKKAIVEPERRKEALTGIKAYSKQWKKLQKTNKKQVKALKKLNKDLSSDSQEISDLFEHYRTDRRKVKDELIEFRLQIQELMTDEEWETVIDQIENIKPKKEKKLEKKQLKSRLKQDSRLLAIRDEIETAFSDPDKVDKVKKSLLDFEEDLINLMDKSQEDPINVLEVMRNRNASREDISNVVVLQEDYRAKAHSSFLDMRMDLVELSTEDNWPKIAKALNKLF